MIRILILIAGLISFVTGLLIFLVGAGAIAGCAGGLIALFLGAMISLLGVGAVINFVVSSTQNSELTVDEIVEMAERNGRWSAFRA